MSQEYKFVPVKPTREMLEAMIAPLGYNANGDPEPALFEERYASALAAAPIPSVESGGGVDFGFDDRSVRVSQEAYSIFIAREEGAKAQITRLTAENARLQDLAIRRKNDQTEMCTEIVDLTNNYNALQAELTKARELLQMALPRVKNPVLESAIKQHIAHQSVPAANFIACNADESCGQNAPAAKG